jgi:hypothetical protein
MVDQLAGGGIALLGLVFGQDRHEGLRKRAFAEQAAQQVGQAEGDVEGVGIGGGAEGTGKQGVAQQAGDAGQHRHAGDGRQGLSRFIGRDYSWAIERETIPAPHFAGQSGPKYEFGIAL